MNKRQLDEQILCMRQGSDNSPFGVTSPCHAILAVEGAQQAKAAQWRYDGG
jgi:hypothetical protein